MDAASGAAVPLEGQRGGLWIACRAARSARWASHRRDRLLDCPTVQLYSLRIALLYPLLAFALSFSCAAVEYIISMLEMPENGPEIPTVHEETPRMFQRSMAYIMRCC